MKSRRSLLDDAIWSACVLTVLTAGSAIAAPIEVFHADSLAGPCAKLRKGYSTAKNTGVTID